MSDAPTVHIDPPAFWDDPYPTLARMRAETPICFVPELGATLLTRRDHIHTCEKNVAVFSSDQPGGLMNVLMGKNMMRSDGEEHRQERFVSTRPSRPEPCEPRGVTYSASSPMRCSTSLVLAGTADLVREYATVVSGDALRELTGLTNVSATDLDAWSQAMIDGVSNYGGDPDVEARCHWATGAIDAAIDELLPVLLAEPDSSLLSVMTAADMPTDRVAANIRLTISGGQNEPLTPSPAPSGHCSPIRSSSPPSSRVRSPGSRPSRSTAAGSAPIGMSPRRIATEYTFDGVTFEPEERVFLMFGSANRDEEHFDQPDLFDITRDLSQPT
ncbi:MAG: hypothetical protein R2710_08530 [Acidimicrobiales bacterium]